MKIKEINYNKIIFDDGSVLSYYHEQECCEHVYADFKNLQIMTKLGSNSIDSNVLEFDENLMEYITPIKDVGFEIEDKNGIKLFVSCYNSQNGYYSSDLKLIYMVNKNGRELITTMNISDCVEDRIY